MERATQVDIAQIAGFSRATVLYVLTGRTNDRIIISPETKHRVFEVVAKLGYIPDAQAQALHSARAVTICVIMPDIHNPHFWQQYVEEIDLAAQDAGYHLLVPSASLDPKQEQKNRTCSN